MISRQLLIATVVLFLAATALSLYVWHLRHHEAQSPQPAATQPAPEPAAGSMEKVTVWVAHDDSGMLRPQTASIPLTGGRQQKAEALMRDLIDLYTAKDSPHPLPVGAEVRSVYLVDPGLAVIDINTAFASGQTSGILAEDLTIASLIETLSTNTPGLQHVRILIDGKEAATLAGHADVSNLYDISEIDELAKQLSSQ